MQIPKNKQNRCDHFAVAVAFINHLHETDTKFAFSELTSMLFRFIVDNNVPASQANVSKVFYYVKNYIRVKAAESISIARGGGAS